nr:RNA-directed DNA polymerase, eukaryota, reverse transcriptase zinc-binding domain protein [Tanacetum cinerariifolium]
MVFMMKRDCKILVEKLENRVNDWRNKFLSLAGRLQLIRSGSPVISSKKRKMKGFTPRLMDQEMNERSFPSIIARLVLAASAYFLWRERNLRLFQKKKMTVDQLVRIICDTIRLKLITFRFKKMSTGSRLLLDQWRVPSYCIVHDGSAGLIWVSFAPIVVLLDEEMFAYVYVWILPHSLYFNAFLVNIFTGVKPFTKKRNRDAAATKVLTWEADLALKRSVTIIQKEKDWTKEGGDDGPRMGF